jgi:hypothetical protein
VKTPPESRRAQKQHPRELVPVYSTKTSLNGGFHVSVSNASYFRNSAEEFHSHETLSTPMKLLSSLSSLIRCHISIFNCHETLMKSHWDWPNRTTGLFCVVISQRKRTRYTTGVTVGAPLQTTGSSRKSDSSPFSKMHGHLNGVFHLMISKSNTSVLEV